MRPSRPRARPGLVALPAPVLAAVLVLVLGSCSGGSAPSRVDPGAALATAKRTLDATSGVHVRLATPALPAGTNGLLGATGVGTHAPAFEGTIRVSTRGIVADAAVVAVDERVYAKLPFTSRFVVIDPADYRAPDPAALMGRRGGLSSLLTAARHPHSDGRVRQGSAVLTRVAATVPGGAVQAVIPSARSAASFPATFTLDDRGRLSSAVLTGPFYPGAKDVTYTIDFDHYGTRRDIRAP